MLGWSGRDRNRVGVPVCKFGVVSYLLGVIASGVNLHVAFVLYVLTPLFFITPQRAHEGNIYQRTCVKSQPSRFTFKAEP